MTSQAKLPFITLKMKPNEYHQLMPTLLDYAKTKRLYDYVVGNETVKTQDALNMQNQSKISIYLWHSSTYWYAQYRFSTYLVRTCTICTPGLPATHPPRFITRDFTYSSFTIILESHSIIMWLSKISYIYIPLFLYYCHPLIICIS